MDRVREGMGGEWGENAQEGNCVCCGRRGRAGGERRLNTEDPRRRRKEGEGAGDGSVTGRAGGRAGRGEEWAGAGGSRCGTRAERRRLDHMHCSAQTWRLRPPTLGLAVTAPPPSVVLPRAGAPLVLRRLVWAGAPLFVSLFALARLLARAVPRASLVLLSMCRAARRNVRVPARTTPLLRGSMHGPCQVPY